MNVLDRLETNKNLRSPNDIAEFSAATEELDASSLNEAEVARLLLVLNDEASNQEILWGLLHVLEDAPLETFVGAALLAVPKMQETAPDWSETVLCRLINGSRARSIVENWLQRASPTETRSRLLEGLRHIANGNDAVALQSAKLLKTVEQQ